MSYSAGLFRLERSSLVLICIVLRSFASTGIARGFGEYHIPLSGATCRGALVDLPDLRSSRRGITNVDLMTTQMVWGVQFNQTHDIKIGDPLLYAT